MIWIDPWNIRNKEELAMEQRGTLGIEPWNKEELPMEQRETSPGTKRDYPWDKKISHEHGSPKSRVKLD